MLNIFPNDTDSNTSLLSLVMCCFISDLSVKNMFKQCARLCSISEITVFDELYAHEFYRCKIIRISSHFSYFCIAILSKCCSIPFIGNA